MDDLISREAAIRWVKQECNPYGKPTLDFESGKRVMEHLEMMPSAQPEHLIDDDFETIRILLSAFKGSLCNQHMWKEAEDYERLISRFMSFASAQSKTAQNISDGDLISRQAAIDAVKSRKTAEQCEKGEVRNWAVDLCVDALNKLPSAQPEQKCGRWLITDAYPHNVYCSQCYKTFAQTHWAVWEDGTLPRNFCPNCGVKMEVSE